MIYGLAGNMGVEVNHYRTTLDEFKALEEAYPTGMHGNRNGTHWFRIVIREMNLELTWFLAHGLEMEE